MQQYRPILKKKETQYSIEPVDSNKILHFEEFCNRKPNKDCASRTREDEQPDPPVVSQRVLIAPSTHRDEPNYFHF
jgi:hypothetical protein